MEQELVGVDVVLGEGAVVIVVGIVPNVCISVATITGTLAVPTRATIWECLRVRNACYVIYVVTVGKTHVCNCFIHADHKLAPYVLLVTILHRITTVDYLSRHLALRTLLQLITLIYTHFLFIHVLFLSLWLTLHHLFLMCLILMTP